MINNALVRPRDGQGGHLQLPTPTRPRSATAPSTGAGDSAKRMMVPTLADVMRDQLKSRVATMSMKARSAIGLAGHNGDFVTWFGDRERVGNLERLHARRRCRGSSAFLKGNPVDARRRQDLGAHAAGRALPVRRRRARRARDRRLDGDVSASAGRAPATRRTSRTGCSRRSPTSTSSGWRRPRSTRWTSAPRIGPTFSASASRSLDAVGHSYGPRSHEVQDMLVRLDITLGKLLDYLDKKVGAGQVRRRLERRPRRRRLSGADRGRRPPADGRGARGDRDHAAAGCSAAKGRTSPRPTGGDIYFKPGVYDRLKANRDALSAVDRRALGAAGRDARLHQRRCLDGRRRARRRTESSAPSALSYFPGRSGDLMVLAKENWLLSSTGTTHGRCTRTTSGCRSSSTAPASCRARAKTPPRRRTSPSPSPRLVGVKLPSPTAAC